MQGKNSRKGGSVTAIQKKNVGSEMKSSNRQSIKPKQNNGYNNAPKAKPSNILTHKNVRNAPPHAGKQPIQNNQNINNVNIGKYPGASNHTPDGSNNNSVQQRYPERRNIRNESIPSEATTRFNIPQLSQYRSATQNTDIEHITNNDTAFVANQNTFVGQTSAYTVAYTQNFAGQQPIRNPIQNQNVSNHKRRATPKNHIGSHDRSKNKKILKELKKKQQKILREQYKKDKQEQKHRNEAFRRAEKLRLKYDPAVINARNERKHHRAEIRNMLLARFLLVLIAYMMIMGLVIGGNAIAFKLTSNTDDNEYTLVINSTLDEPTKISLPRSLYYHNGTYYFDMSAVARELDLTATGTLTNLRFINADTLDAVYLSDGSTEIIINTVSARLTAPIICSGNKMLVPVDFFRHYISGITVSVDTEKHLFILDRTIIGYNTSMLHGTTPIYEEVNFTLKDPSSMEHIRENSLPTDILYDTDPLRLAEEAVKAAEEARKAEEEARKAQELAAQLGYGSIG